jgi:gamma-glutamylaminecyclotransferase
MGSAATIFVYGTLKRGCRNHSVFQSAEFVSEAWTEPGFRMVHCGAYPGMVRAEQGESVCGELYRVDAALLAALDRFEDAPNEYERVTIRLSDGAEAQAYLYRGETAHLAECGPVWKES